jgi:hypothetical protein
MLGEPGMVMLMTAVTAKVSPLSLTCRACGKTWKVAPKPDGSVPINSRCPRAAGGCGSLRKVPRGPAVRSRWVAAFPVWDAPSPRRGPYRTAELCPACGEPLTASPLGTARACLPCGNRVTPPGVTAPYDCQEASAGRTVRSQADRDDEALALAERAGVLLDAIAGVLGDDRLHPAARARLEWYAAEITGAARARRGARVGELADRLSGQRIRRAHWWNSDAQNPAAITAGGNGDQDDDDEVWDAEVAGEEAPRSPAAPGADRFTGLAARGYTMNLAAPAGMCQLIMACRHGWAAQPEPCAAGAQRVFEGIRVCVIHYEALTMPLGRT